MFDLETGMRVASNVGNLPSKFGHARHLPSRIICYVRDGRTDRQTDDRTYKSNAYCLLSNGRGHNNMFELVYNGVNFQFMGTSHFLPPAPVIRRGLRGVI